MYSNTKYSFNDSFEMGNSSISGSMYSSMRNSKDLPPIDGKSILEKAK